TAIALDSGTGLRGLLCAFAELICAGVNVDVARLFQGRNCRVGDPARLSSLQRDESPARMAWLLNGSGARRAGEPVRQIGVTLEQASIERAQVPNGASAASNPIQISTASNAAHPVSIVPPTEAPTRPKSRWSREAKMHHKRPGP